MPVDLNHPQSPVIVLIQDGFHARRLAGSRIAEQKDIVCGAACDESLGICDQLLFLQLVSDQVRKNHIACGRDRLQSTAAVIAEAEGFVEAEFAYAVLPVKIRHNPVYFFSVARITDRRAERLDFFADAPVKNALLLAHRAVIADYGKAVDPEGFFNSRKIIIKELPEHGEILLRKMIDGSVDRPGLLRYQRERSFRHREQESQVIVPQIAIKSIRCRQVKQGMDYIKDLPCQCIRLVMSLIEPPEDLRQAKQYAVLWNIAVNNQFRHQSIHARPPFISDIIIRRSSILRQYPLIFTIPALFRTILLR